MRHFYTCILFIFITLKALAQGVVPPQALSFSKASESNQEGFGYVSPDSSYAINLSFRMQSRAIYNTASATDLGTSAIEARIRRLRLKLNGHVVDPRLTYYIQLSFSRGDMDWSGNENSTINESPNVIRDAVIYFQPNEHFQFIFGQTKLPGNRQRVISSGDQQFIGRSIVNALFNVDRDFGFQLYYFNHLGNLHYVLKSAVTTGEGRNVTFTNNGLAYTGRVDLLPLGPFTDMGDYYEGDLAREETVKVAIGGGMSYNNRARRTAAQTGEDLYESRNIRTYFYDGILKYQGYALQVEYMQRGSGNALTLSPEGDLRYIITGHGTMVQTSYLFRNNLEIAGRYASFVPGKQVQMLEAPETVYTTGLTKYLRKHRVKLQLNISYHDLRAIPAAQVNDYWNAGFQVELGI